MCMYRKMSWTDLYIFQGNSAIPLHSCKVFLVCKRIEIDNRESDIIKYIRLGPPCLPVSVDRNPATSAIQPWSALIR